MSNFFEQELRKLFADGTIIRDPVFVGRACLGSLDRNRQVRAEFVTLGHADHYAALRLTLFGPVKPGRHPQKTAPSAVIEFSQTQTQPAAVNGRPELSIIGIYHGASSLLPRPFVNKDEIRT